MVNISYLMMVMRMALLISEIALAMRSMTSVFDYSSVLCDRDHERRRRCLITQCRQHQRRCVPRLRRPDRQRHCYGHERLRCPVSRRHCIKQGIGQESDLQLLYFSVFSGFCSFCLRCV